ncbi:MAG: hypothetical protein ACTS4W_00400 [Candidatus Hodgkinia cicadicola]
MQRREGECISIDSVVMNVKLDGCVNIPKGRWGYVIVWKGVNRHIYIR